MADPDVSAAMDAAIAAVATAIVERVKQVLGVILGTIGSLIGVIEAAVAVVQALVYPVLGDVSALQSIRDGLTSMRAALQDFEDWTGAELNDVARDGVLATIAAASTAAGFPLDSENPFSAASLTAAINERLGTEFEDVTDPESIAKGLKGIAAEKVSEVIGVDGAFTADNIEDPQAWGGVLTALVSDALAENQSAAFLSDSVCEVANLVLSELCQTPKCNRCMGTEEEELCIKKREKAKRHRERHPRDCTYR